MGIIVQKFGGSSVADTDRLFKACSHIIKEVKKENKVIVIVSAQRKNYRWINKTRTRNYRKT